MSQFIHLILKYKNILAYIIFGVCTTLVNIVSYWVCCEMIGIPNIPAVIIAWILAVSFAFFTNKLWVFESKSLRKSILFYELVTFCTCRLMTGVIDVVVMYLAVDLLSLNPVAWKAIANLLIILTNFIASKYFIFIHKNKG